MLKIIADEPDFVYQRSLKPNKKAKDKAILTASLAFYSCRNYHFYDRSAFFSVGDL